MPGLTVRDIQQDLALLWDDPQAHRRVTVTARAALDKATRQVRSASTGRKG